MVLLETAVLEKPHLAGFFLEIGRRGIAEFFHALFAGQGEPIGLSCLDGDLGRGVGNTALPEIQADTDRALALVDTGLHKTLGKAGITLQTFTGELGNGLLCNVALEALVRELLDQFCLPILTAGQEIHGLFASLERRSKAILPLVGEKIADFFV